MYKNDGIVETICSYDFTVLSENKTDDFIVFQKIFSFDI